MKKISLKNLNLKEVEQLSRSQLKEVLGGGSTWTTNSTPGPTTEDCELICETEEAKCTTSDCKTGSCVYSGTSLVCVTS